MTDRSSEIIFHLFFTSCTLSIWFHQSVRFKVFHGGMREYKLNLIEEWISIFDRMNTRPHTKISFERHHGTLKSMKKNRSHFNIYTLCTECWCKNSTYKYKSVSSQIDSILFLKFLSIQIADYLSSRCFRWLTNFPCRLPNIPICCRRFDNNNSSKQK